MSAFTVFIGQGAAIRASSVSVPPEGPLHVMMRSLNLRKDKVRNFFLQH